MRKQIKSYADCLEVFLASHNSDVALVTPPADADDHLRGIIDRTNAALIAVAEHVRKDPDAARRELQALRAKGA